MQRRATTGHRVVGSVTYSPASRPTRVTAIKRAAVTVKAELTVDTPSIATPIAQNATPSAVQSAEQSSSSCPFLAALATPPVVKVPWHKRFQQLFQPQSFQRLLLQDGTASMVQVEKQIGFTNFYMPADPDVVKEVFAGELNGTTTQSNIPSFVNLMGKESLVLVQEPRHKYLRGLLQPAFSAQAISGYMPAIQELVCRHLRAWQAAGDSGIKGYDGLKLMTFEFIISITLGRQYSPAEVQALSELNNTWTRGFLAWPWLDIPFTPYSNAMRAREKLIEHFQQATDAARAKMAAGQPVPGIIGSLTAAVDEQGNRLTDEQITDNILLLLLAGHDTSSTTLTRIMSNLQDNPAVMQRLRQEQAALVARHGQQLTAAVLNDMKYADAVIRESLRINPVVSGLFRVAAQDIALDGFAVPKGTQLLLPLHHLATTDERWVDQSGDLSPSVFNPERMMTEDGTKPGAQMYFGYGPRFCLGAGLAMAEMKAFLAMLARCYSFTADNNTEWRQAVGLIPVNGLPLVVKPLATETAAAAGTTA